MSTIRFAPQKRISPPKVDGGKVSVRECPVAPRKLPPTKFQVIGPIIMIVAFIGMMGLMLSQSAFRSGIGLFALMMPVMMLVSFMGMYNRSGGADNKVLSSSQLEEERRSYLVELDDTRDLIQGDAERQFEQYQHLHPEPALLRGLVGSVRMWERSSQQSDLNPYFGDIRFGVGTSGLDKELAAPYLGDSVDYEPVCYEALDRFILRQKSIEGIAKPISLQAHPLIVLVGDDTVFGVAPAMICQATCFHSPQDLKIMVVTDDSARWDWVKWLPHCQHDQLIDAGGPARMVWTSSVEMNNAVGKELHGRDNFAKGGIAIVDGKPTFRCNVRPYWLVINDQKKTDSEWDAICRKGVGGVAGVSFMRLEIGE